MKYVETSSFHADWAAVGTLSPIELGVGGQSAVTGNPTYFDSR